MPHIYGPGPSAAAHAARATEIARDVLAKHASEVDREGRFPAESIAALAESRFFGLTVATEYGGEGEGPRAFATVVEELAQSCASTAMIYVMHVTASQAIASSGTLSGREQVLRDIVAGRHLSTLAFSERGSRSQFWAPVSTLVAKGDGFTTRAEKSWVTAAGHAASYVSSAQMPGASSPMESVLYLVRPATAQVRTAARFDGLGLRGNDSAPVVFEDLAVAQGDLLTPLGEGARGMLEVVLPWFAIGTAAMANGLARAAVTAVSGHLQGAGFAHTGTQLRDLPVLRARLAAMSVRTEASRALLGYTLGEMENPSATTALHVLQARLAALEAADCVSDLAMKACGGAAFSRHLPIERIFRDARAGWVMAPTVDHLHDFVGRALTGMPLF